MLNIIYSVSTGIDKAQRAWAFSNVNATTFFLHVHVLWSNPFFQSPIKPMNQWSQHQPQHSHCHWHTNQDTSYGHHQMESVQNHSLWHQFLFPKISGSNEYGFSQVLESLPIAYPLTSTCAFSGTVNPQSCVQSAVRGIRKGAGGCNLRVSLATASKYGSWAASSFSIGFSFPMISCSSAWAFLSFSVFRSSSAIGVVCAPAENRPAGR